MQTQPQCIRKSSFQNKLSVMLFIFKSLNLELPKNINFFSIIIMCYVLDVRR